MLLAGHADDAEQQSIKEHGVERSQTEEDSAREGDKADAQVVGHDHAAGYGLDADNRVRPHFVALDGVDHFRTQHVAHELRTRQRKHRAQQRAGQQDDERKQDVANLLLDQGRIFIAQEVENLEEAFAAA